MILAAPIILERCRRQPIQVKFVGGLNESLIKNQARDDTDGERAATEAEAKNLIVFVLIIAADKFINIDDVAFQSIAESAAQNRERFEARSPYAIIIKRHLIRIRQIKRVERTPDVCAPEGGRGVSGAVRQHNDFSSHCLVLPAQLRRYRLSDYL